jgi:Mn-containing catalase
MDHNQSISILKDLGDPEELLDVHPIPESFPDEVENQEFNYQYRSTNLEPQDDPGEPWTSGEAPDMEGEFTFANKHDLEGVPINVPQADPRTYNDPTPEGED